MYVYFDEQGILKEIISEPIRRGSADYNSILVYVEGLDRGDYWAIFERADSELTPEREYTETVEAEIPYDPKRDLGYFKYFKEYTFHKINVDPEVLQVAGTAVCTIRINVDGALFALGRITFNVEDNAIKEDHGITQSQYDYLIERGAATYFYPNVDTESGTLYWTNNAGLDNPPPAHLAGLGPESVSTSDIADGAVTPAKLDRAYLPLAGGTVTGPTTFKQNVDAQIVTAKGNLNVDGLIYHGGQFLEVAVEEPGEGNARTIATREWAIGEFLRSASDITFTGNNTYSGANTFSGENTFSGDNNFTAENTRFTSGVTFSGTTTMKGKRNSADTLRIYESLVLHSGAVINDNSSGKDYSFDASISPDQKNVIATKSYVDTKTDDKVVKDPSAQAKVYGTDASGNETTYQATSLALGGTIPLRNSSGSFNCGTPLDPGNIANKKYVDDQIAKVRNGVVQIVSQLPDTGEAGVFYFVPSGEGYEQWAYENNQWIDMGNTQIDLSDYYNKTEVDQRLNAKLDNAASSVGSSNIANGAVTPNKLDKTATYEVGGLKSSGTIQTPESGYAFQKGDTQFSLPDAGGELLTDASEINVGENDIQDGAVTTAKLADGAVTGDKIADNAITASKIADKAIASYMLQDGAVDEGMIAPGAVTEDTLSDALANNMAKINSREQNPGSDGFTQAMIVNTPRDGGNLQISPLTMARTVRIDTGFTLADRERSHEFVKFNRYAHIYVNGMNQGDKLWVAGFDKASVCSYKHYNQSDYMRRKFSGYPIELTADVSEPSYEGALGGGMYFNIIALCNKIFNCNTLEITKRTSTDQSDVWGNGTISLGRVFHWFRQADSASPESPIGYGEGTLDLFSETSNYDVGDMLSDILRRNNGNNNIIKIKNSLNHITLEIPTPQNGRYYTALYTTIGLKFAKDFERTAVGTYGECGYTKKTLIANTMVELLCCAIFSSEAGMGRVKHGDPFQLWITTRGRKLYI